MKMNFPNASFLAVQKEMQHVQEMSGSYGERHTLELVKGLLFKLCAYASVSTIAHNPRVVGAVAVLLSAVSDHLKVRLQRQKSGFFLGLLSVRPIFNSTSEAVDRAKNTLNQAIHEAWVEAEGRDPRNDEDYHTEFCALTGMAP